MKQITDNGQISNRFG